MASTLFLTSSFGRIAMQARRVFNQTALIAEINSNKMAQVKISATITSRIKCEMIWKKYLMGA